MFAGGLSMFGSEDDQSEAKNEEEPEEPNAGIEITLMDTQLRPFVFFTGQGELMGHVWSGTASERTTALQVNTFHFEQSNIIGIDHCTHYSENTINIHSINDISKSKEYGNYF